ncbi:MAG: hypothetical protein A2428_03545 [Bdellovibrionales bacterium RIFOXYC1_FULL_54_43]|nr:MAG: hypothetical protein A2428_03545 [Bdellovibrionales bacterium RIFOXYC1_FULL_54_43]OFZ84988.1 MAG: hypothetical protein A2603_04180 [Bdellovibrionales bacterium RIFOXYD1_FULL_55_31]
MKVFEKRNLGVALGAGVLATFVMLPLARGELVFEDDPRAGAAAGQAAARVEERDLTRQTLNSAERARVSNQLSEPVSQVQPQAMVVPVQQVMMQPQVPAVESAALSVPAVDSGLEVQNLSKSELMRRERVRAELRNEDVLQERLEELRLRDERRRSDQLLAQPGETLPEPVAVSPMKTETVISPITERPGSANAMIASAGTPVAEAPFVQQELMASAQPAGMTVSSGFIKSSPDEDKVSIYVQPRAGVATMNPSVNYYDFRPHFSVGMGLGVGVSDNLSFELGYSFSEFGVAYNTGYQFAGYPGMAYAPGMTNETFSVKQNVADVGMKLHFLGPDARLRPFVGGGGAYSKNFINYDQNILAQMNPAYLQVVGQDYDFSQFLGFLSTGFDVRVNKSVSVGATFKYFSVLSARHEQKFFAGYPGGYAMEDPNKQPVGNAILKAAFYSITGGVSFVF